MFRRCTLATGLAVMVGTGSMAQGECFTHRQVVLPDYAKILPRLSNGPAGRELAEAVWQGDAEAAAAQLRADPSLADTRVIDDPELTSQPDGRYGDLLTFAVARCDRAMMVALLSAGLDPNGVRPGEALALALLSDDPYLPETLLAAGASPDPQKAGGQDVFRTIAGFNHLGAAMMLVRHGLDVAWADQFGHTHLDTALAMQAYRIADHLVQEGADLWTADRYGYMPAHELAAPPVFQLDEEDEAARSRLIEAAQASGRVWPPAPP